jgi:hypothetical protein
MSNYTKPNMRNPSKKKIFSVPLCTTSLPGRGGVCPPSLSTSVVPPRSQSTTPRWRTLSRNAPHVPAHPDATSATSLPPLPAHPPTVQPSPRQSSDSYGAAVGGGMGVGGGIGRDGERVGGGRSSGEALSVGRPTTRSGTVSM